MPGNFTTTFIALSDEQVEELRVAVKKGRLFDVQGWTAAGKPLFKKYSRKKQALKLAVESGFHSMVEILARVWPDQETLNEAMRWAAHKRRKDLVWLLLDAGAEMKAVGLDDIADCCDKKLLIHFLDHWDALGDDYALMWAVLARIRPLIGVIRDYAPRIPNYQIQLAGALNSFIEEESLKWVALTLWMGADPRQPGPTPLMNFSEDPEDCMSPLEYSFLKGSPGALKLMKPSPELDDLNGLLAEYRLDENEGLEIAEYLVGLGANINNLPNGGSSVLRDILNPCPRFKQCPSYGLSWHPSDAEK